MQKIELYIKPLQKTLKISHYDLWNLLIKEINRKGEKDIEFKWLFPLDKHIFIDCDNTYTKIIKGQKTLIIAFNLYDNHKDYIEYNDILDMLNIPNEALENNWLNIPKIYEDLVGDNTWGEVEFGLIKEKDKNWFMEYDMEEEEFIGISLLDFTKPLK